MGSADGRKEKLGEGIKMSEMVQDKRKEERETPREKKDFHLRVKLQINTDEPVLGPGVAELLELVEETGSMKEACGRMGMSYSKGWKITGRAEQELGYPLILRSHGGRTGGSCSVTQEGLSLIRRYRALEEKVKEYASGIFKDIFEEL
nr:molybdenum transporter [uncultured Lachnoclostridium sp.]